MCIRNGGIWAGCLAAVLLLLAWMPVSAAERFDVRELVVKDRRTGLVWARNANLPAKELSLAEAREFIRQLNRAMYGGRANWRLPTRQELMTLVKHGFENGYGKDVQEQAERTINYFLSTQGFTGVRPGSYWTTGKAGQRGFDSWVIFMEDGSDYQGTRAGRNYLWPVRSGR